MIFLYLHSIKWKEDREIEAMKEQIKLKKRKNVVCLCVCAFVHLTIQILKCRLHVFHVQWIEVVLFILRYEPTAFCWYFNAKSFLQTRPSSDSVQLWPSSFYPCNLFLLFEMNVGAQTNRYTSTCWAKKSDIGTYWNVSWLLHLCWLTFRRKIYLIK